MAIERLFDELTDEGHADWAGHLRKSAGSIMTPAANGHMTAWEDVLRQLPPLTVDHLDLAQPTVKVDGVCSPEEREQLRILLEQLHPWRKGPFELFGIVVDAEWRSDLKWERVASHVDLRDKDVLDVGCGNGYYGWRMLGAGARRVIGLEPYPLYNMQHRLLKAFLPTVRNHVIPAGDNVLSSAPVIFDVAFSMGVLYHCKDPIGHLELVRNSLRAGGQLILESLVVDGDERTALIPRDRYAKMRNVWLIPSTAMLLGLLGRVGFREATVLDVAATTPVEQRTTDWMRFESLSDFLAPGDPTQTIEGLPAPKRAILRAARP